MSACDCKQKAAQRWSSHTANETWSNGCVCCSCLAWHIYLLIKAWLSLISVLLLHFCMCSIVWNVAHWCFRTLDTWLLYIRKIGPIVKESFSLMSEGPLWNISAHIDCFIGFALHWSEARSHFSCSRKPYIELKVKGSTICLKISIISWQGNATGTEYDWFVNTSNILAYIDDL